MRTLSTEVEWPADRPKWVIRLEWALLDDRWECVGFAVAPLPNTSPSSLLPAELHQMPLGKIKEASWPQLPEKIQALIEEGSTEAQALAPQINWCIVQDEPIPNEMIDAAMDRAAAARAQQQRIDQDVARLRSSDLPRTGRGRPPLPREHYERVADVYGDARRDGQPPRRAVINHFGASESTVDNWIARCRDLHLLETTTPGKSSRRRRPKEGAAGTPASSDRSDPKGDKQK